MIDIIYDHYLAIDWSNINMAIARMTKKSNKITVIDVPSDIVELKVYLKNLRGTRGMGSALIKKVRDPNNLKLRLLWSEY